MALWLLVLLASSCTFVALLVLLPKNVVKAISHRRQSQMDIQHPGDNNQPLLTVDRVEHVVPYFGDNVNCDKTATHRRHNKKSTTLSTLYFVNRVNCGLCH